MCVSHFINPSIIPKGVSTAFDAVGKIGKELGSKSFWEGMGRAFGAPPSGYVYSFSIFNDTAEEVYIGKQQMASFMGGTFPIGHRDTTVVKPFNQSYSQKNQKYYFELTINDGPNAPANSMPYNASGALYVQDCIKLLEKNSTKNNYFRTYIGKSLDNGNYVHGLRAEYVGYTDHMNPKDSGASVVITDSMSSLVIYNNTEQDYEVGYCSSRNPQMTKQDCIVVTTIEANSFALLNATQSAPLNSGILGIFEGAVDKPTETFLFPAKILGDKNGPKKYTLELYQDAGQNELKMGLQGVMAGHYDMPSGRIRDITPVNMVFWYKSVAELSSQKLKQEGLSKSNFTDLPGQLWMVSKGEQGPIMSKIDLGTATQFTLVRPLLREQEKWIYFLYIDTTDTQTAQQFINNFISGFIGQDVIQTYHQQAAHQIQLAENQKAITFGKGTKLQDSSQAPQSLLIEAIQGALKLHQGQITDPRLKTSGYLLGSDVFLPLGTGASSTYYYQLSPSNNLNPPGATGPKTYVPTSAVNNQFAYTLSGKAPTSMPVVKRQINFAVPQAKG